MTEPYKYEMIIYWSAEDSAFVVEVPELPGCMADGPTPALAVASAQEAIAIGSPLPESWADPFRSHEGVRFRRPEAVTIVRPTAHDERPPCFRGDRVARIQ
jgi:hypothetical protein